VLGKKCTNRPPRGTFWCKVSEGKGLSLDFPLSDFAVKGEGPAFDRVLFFSFLSTFNSSELSETKMPVLADLFLAFKWFILNCLWIF
jgi:hypothetical protein